MKKLIFALLCSLCLSGCLSHYFVETSTRLQVENGTDDMTIIAVDVISEDEKSSLPWIEDMVLPGERSHVVEKNWVGEFTFRVKYTKSVDGSGEILQDFHKLDVEGGSIFLKIGSDEDSLSYRIR